MSTVQKLTDKGLINPPSWLPDNVMYEVIMGSSAYGVSNDSSDLDIYGWGIPPKAELFPNLKGLVPGFDEIQGFDQFQQHHVKYEDALGGKGREYDLSIYNIVKYFKLCMDNNPNMIDSLFVPLDCVVHSTQVGNLVRENRKIFLHKGSYYKFLGYAHSQLHKMKSQEREGKRKELYEKWGFDIKFAYHLVRLSYECEMILAEHDLDLRRHREHLKAVRRGDVSEQDIRDWFAAKEKYLEKLYQDSTLQHKPDVSKIRNLLLTCLEHHYGTIDNVIEKQDKYKNIVTEIRQLLDRNKV